VENNVWKITLANSHLTPRKSLVLARKAVDETFKREVEFTRHPALLVDSYAVHPVIVTSYCSPDDTGRYARGQEVWISKVSDNAREKVNEDRLREDTAENREIIRQIQYAREQEQHFSSLRYSLLSKLSPYALRTQTPKA
jgi:hypothetical protein